MWLRGVPSYLDSPGEGLEAGLTGGTPTQNPPERSSGVECLLSICEALGFIPFQQERKKGKERMEGRKRNYVILCNAGGKLWILKMCLLTFLSENNESAHTVAPKCGEATRCAQRSQMQAQRDTKTDCRGIRSLLKVFKSF